MGEILPDVPVVVRRDRSASALKRPGLLDRRIRLRIAGNLGMGTALWCISAGKAELVVVLD